MPIDRNEPYKRVSKWKFIIGILGYLNIRKALKYFGAKDDILMVLTGGFGIAFWCIFSAFWFIFDESFTSEASKFYLVLTLMWAIPSIIGNIEIKKENNV